MSRWVVWAAAALCLAGYIFIYATDRASQPIRSDGFSYYVYLPAWFIFHDPTLRAVARDCCGGEFPAFTAIIRWPGSRRWVNAHPIGVALMQAPFFLAAHALTRWSNLSPDGFSLYYQHGAGLSGLFWTIAGLWILRNLLRRHFSERVTAATVGTLLLGTNLYHYATFDASYSHAYSFFLFAAFLDLTERWHHAPSRRLSLLVGLVAGLIIVTRHTNALFLMTFPLYGVTGRASFQQVWRELLSRKHEILVIAVVAALIVAPQLALYYQATGRVLVSSYGGLGFNFASPQLFGVLLSVQKGVFFWSPLLIVAAVGLALPRVRAFRVPLVVFLAINTYLIASWWDWQFGASYGHRGFVDSLPVFALGLATVFEWAGTHPVRRTVFTAVVFAAIGLSTIQMLQYWNGVMPMSDTTWEQYRATFLKLR